MNIISWIKCGFITLLLGAAVSNIAEIQNGLDRGMSFCARGHSGTTIKVEKGDYGFIASLGYPDNYTTEVYHGQLCNVEMQACLTCKIRLTFAQLQLPECEEPDTVLENRIRSVCIPGCDHLRMFEADQPYHRFTEKNYFASAEGSVHETISSRIVLQHCMSNSSFYLGKKFKIKYEVIDKIQIVTGIVRPPLYTVITGHITSPNFPNGYAQNGETYTYILQNLDPYGHVRLVFDDWDVSEKSHLQAYDDLSGPTRSTIYSYSERPTILSNTNTLVIVFNTGKDPFGCCNHTGFKATFHFVSDDKWTDRPRTDCGETVLLQTGGVINFDAPILDYPRWFDCIWTIKRYITNYPDGVILRIHEVKLGEGWLQDGINKLEIYDGLTSEGEELASYTSSNLSAGEIVYSSGQGLYIRLRGLFNNLDKVHMVYTGVNNITAAGCPKTAEFTCDNLWCIHEDLKCDGIDHCGDNSDENPVFVCLPEDTLWGWQGLLQFTTEVTTMPHCYGGFRCHDDSGCIQPNQLCDNFDHCKDRSDETSCSLEYYNKGCPVFSETTLPVVLSCLILSRLHPSIT